MNDLAAPWNLDRVDRALMQATQSGLPLVPRPYHAIGAQLGLSGEEVMARIGYRANGMSVWDVADERVDALGERVGELPFVSHCYRRVRHPPEWRYNLFAMVHGRSREEVQDKVQAIATLLGAECRAHEVLYSTRILKKTGVRV
jgi:DNA-binding Lrp family transcriptional regulator